MKPLSAPLSPVSSERLFRLQLGLGLLAAMMSLTGAAASPETDARSIIGVSGIKGGIIVHVGCGDGRLTAALRVNSSFQVQGLDTDGAQVTKAREFIQSKGIYGPVSVDKFDGKLMPYIDGLVNLVVAENLGSVPMAEVLRVLTPNGVAMVKQGGEWKKTLKPRNPDMDDWTHYYYDAKGNAVSHDKVVAPPERLQWVGSPRWSRHHDRMSSLSAMVSANGRLAYIMDEGSRISILLPSKWFLTARDAFNGTVLWKKPIENWQSNLWPLKSGPTQLARRLVGDGDTFYVTLAIDAPVSRLDAATGEATRVYAETKGAEEILHVNGVLYVLVNPEPWVLTDFAPKFNTGDQKRVETEFNWDEKPRHLLAVDAASGRVLWKKENIKVAPLTLATDGKRLIFHDGETIVALDPKSGSQRWATAKADKRKLFEFNYGPRLLINNDVVLYAGGDGAMKGFNADSGKELWSAPHQKSGYRSPEDLMVAGGLVWNAPTISGGMSGEFTGRDPVTGEVRKQFPPDVSTYWFHHRCYIAKATDNFLIPSRTGIEFVDINSKHWDINHWVRGACLYGVLPCNGLTYAGPHNCACYPEAKLDGMNALAPAAKTPHPPAPPDEQRLERGPAYNHSFADADADAKDWPTYRHDAKRSGFSDQALLEDLGKAWELKLGGRLSAVTIAAGKAFVAQVDAHTLHALDAATGEKLWRFIAGARIDSPPTYWKGRVLFGGMDGWVYCLRASDGALVWRFQGAPGSRRHVAFEQIESVWPVHGSVLVENGIVSFVAGRSVFLDGGMRFIRLDAATGKKLVESIMDDKDPDTGRDLQELVKTLQMPVGLNDILSSDGKYTYLRSQKFLADGKRIEIAPVSGNAIEQGAAQKGEGAHIFAPMGFLDDSWFHRSYWVYGKHFAGGHNGYYQAGKYTPAGRILVFDDKNVYSYGREPQYYKWTTTMENQLFSASRDAGQNALPPPPDAGGPAGKAKGKNANAAARELGTVSFPNPERLDPANKPLTVEAWVMLDGLDGVVVSHGAGVNGYALTIHDGKPAFHIRSTQQLATAAATSALTTGWHHLAGVLTAEKKLKLFVDGKMVAQANSPLIAATPRQGMHLGGSASGVSGEPAANAFTGLLDQFAIYHRALDDAEIQQRSADANPAKPAAGAVLFCSFDHSDARDESGGNNHGVANGVESGKGKVANALWFRKAPGAPTAPAAPAVATKAAGKAATRQQSQAAGMQQGSMFKDDWHRYVPVVTRAMAMAGKTILLSGPPDVLDEEYAFDKLTKKDKSIYQELQDQDDSLEGKKGGRLWAVSMADGSQKSEVDLTSPPVWDGMAVAQGRLYVASMDGTVRCFGVAKK